MSRFAGRNGRVYVALTNGAAASVMPFIAKWSYKAATDKYDATAMGDPNKIYVTGLPDASGDFSGFMDNASAQTYTAAVDGLARNMYIYPDLQNTPTLYFYGQGLLDFNVDGDVGGVVGLSSSWNAASAWGRMG